MKKGNALVAFINEPTSALAPPNVQPASATKTPRRMQSVVPFRLSSEDHRALKRLAAHDETSMQAMLFDAIKEHASKRGVKLQG